MSRVKFSLPDNLPFSTKVRIRISDINYGGHLSNDRILTLAHDARIEFLKHYRFSEFDIGGTSMIMADAAIVFKSEGFHGDEVEVKMAASDFTRAGFNLYYKLVNLTTGTDLAYVKTGMVAFDYDTRKVMPVPDVFRQKCSA